jgi:hypothetical protein
MEPTVKLVGNGTLRCEKTGAFQEFRKKDGIFECNKKEMN